MPNGCILFQWYLLFLLVDCFHLSETSVFFSCPKHAMMPTLEKLNVVRVL